ncbi:hypothetical protein PVAP13_1NG052900 [Panicum virgatum]|uniref:Uncharacterized protein n=1 Tax=Panicum virgatum TaxID=38727 RepID=A0A8T0WLR9_PANVG|nr:hypothetical protein PVAP13_1NG052900 [Panicum virgatum]
MGHKSCCTTIGTPHSFSVPVSCRANLLHRRLPSSTPLRRLLSLIGLPFCCMHSI